MSTKIFPKLMLQTITFEVSYWVKFWKWTAYHKITQNFENEGRIFTHSSNDLHANFFLNNAKCTYFHPKMYLRGQKMYLVNNVLENQIWAVPLLFIANNFNCMQCFSWARLRRASGAVPSARGTGPPSWRRRRMTSTWTCAGRASR